MNTIFSSQLLTFILGLAALIIIHELGHFLMARLLKVEVEEFGIGFPPRIATLFEAGGTKFSLNWIPLGGFVRPKGENDPTVEGGLAAASPWVRLAVLFAGPAMNLLTGLVLAVWLAYSLGDPVQNKVRIDLVEQGSPAAAAGLRKGDLIVGVNEVKIESVETLQNTIEASLDKPTTLAYERAGQTFTTSLVPRSNPPQGQGAIGIRMDHPTVPIGLGTAISRGVFVLYDYASNVVTLPLKIMEGQASPSENRPVGFKGMFDIYQVIPSPLSFFMLISISLGIFNLFPIPALDGGRILLTLPEIIIRRRIPPQYESMINLIGFALLLLLIIYINVQDFINPIVLPK